MGELFICVAELKRMGMKKGEGHMTCWGKIERLGELMAKKFEIIQHLNPTSIL